MPPRGNLESIIRRCWNLGSSLKGIDYCVGYRPLPLAVARFMIDNRNRRARGNIGHSITNLRGRAQKPQRSASDRTNCDTTDVYPILREVLSGFERYSDQDICLFLDLH